MSEAPGGAPARPIEDYAFIGNMVSGALVARDGSIDWLCLPRFDGDACFAALLGTPENGRWLIGPAAGAALTTRRYRPATAVLETRFETGDGVVTLTDFMPLVDDEDQNELIRVVRGERGRVVMRTELVIRFGYGRVVPWVRRQDFGLRAIAGPDALELHTPVELRGEDFRTVGTFTVAAGDCVPFRLAYHRSHRPGTAARDCRRSLAETEGFWRDWSGRCRHAEGLPAAWREAVERSLITLKCLSFRPTGGIIAAATTSLPERLGGVRNWDYRFCWVRDATLILLALLNAGYREEARAWRAWLLRATAGRPEELQIMYGIAGERRLLESDLPWLPGYAGSRPVRIGNAAFGQRQIDVYGELMDAFHVARRFDLEGDDEAWRVQRVLMDDLARTWRQPDEGIWEVRGGQRHFTHSKVMAWVAMDRAVRAVETFGLAGPVETWRTLRATIHADVLSHGVDPERQTFVQSYGGRSVDAALLLIPQFGFLPPEDPRVRATVAAVERELMADGLVLRYRTADDVDGLPPGEGAFLACSFWLADAYAMTGRRDEAEALFERLLGYRNDVGLLAEEYDPHLGRQLGNVPQGFSHVALVNTANNLRAPDRPSEQRAERTPPR